MTLQIKPGISVIKAAHHSSPWRSHEQRFFVRARMLHPQVCPYKELQQLSHRSYKRKNICHFYITISTVTGPLHLPNSFSDKQGVTICCFWPGMEDLHTKHECITCKQITQREQNVIPLAHREQPKNKKAMISQWFAFKENCVLSSSSG